MQLFSRNLPLQRLTKREVEVLQLVFTGYTSKQIAQQLALSPRTVEVHRANLMNKIGVSSLPQLVEVVLKGQQQLEALLIKNEEHLKDAQRIAHLGSWSWDVATGENAWSDEQYRIFGYVPHAISPSYDLFFKHIHSEDCESVKNSLDACLSGGGDYSAKFRIIRVDGGVRHIQAAGVLERNAAGEPVRITGTLLDVTESEVTKQEIAKSERTYRRLFETVGQGVVYHDTSGKIISANPAAERLLGLSLEQLQGRSSIDSCWQAIHEDGSPFPGETHPSMHVIKTGKPISGVVMGIKNPLVTHTVWIKISANPVFKEGDDEIEHVYTIFDDITSDLEVERGRRANEERLRLAVNAGHQG